MNFSFTNLRLFCFFTLLFLCHSMSYALLVDNPETAKPMTEMTTESTPSISYSIVTETGLNVIDHNLFTEERYQLMKLYTKRHYNMDHAELKKPKNDCYSLYCVTYAKAFNECV